MPPEGITRDGGTPKPLSRSSKWARALFVNSRERSGRLMVRPPLSHTAWASRIGIVRNVPESVIVEVKAAVQAAGQPPDRFLDIAVVEQATGKAAGCSCPGQPGIKGAIRVHFDGGMAYGQVVMGGEILAALWEREGLARPRVLQRRL